MEKKLKNITLKQGYIGMISLKVNIFQIYATQLFFLKRNISSVSSQLNKAYPKKEKNVLCERFISVFIR